MDLSKLLSNDPLLRAGLSAAAVIFVDLCALVILIAASRERRHSDRRWAHENRGFMLACGENLYPLGAAEIVIGRHPSADIRFRDGEISRFHAILTLSAGNWQIEDLSGNGVTVNGRRIDAPCILHRNDVIGIGRRKLTVIRGKKG
ncbi:MAG: FHA domain-containing protein [Oscillospiraceae bacterium]|nr:FHA domain-containing protein [Oscillospiraceae bacterium]MCR5305566.1 FHA domain-containing protein [Oscillospiraceae bacterium]